VDKPTPEEIEAMKKEIDGMDRMSMARLWRFAPAGHPFFRHDIPELSERFANRFLNELGGFNPQISKQLGW
jgi:hypothetical protein